MVAPPFDGHEYTTLLANWGVNRRLSAAYFPQSNGRAEAAVKTAKRILANNTDSFGRLDSDNVARALLLHRNTPVLDADISPAVMLYGHPIRDHLPSVLSKERIRHEWTAIRDLREEAMAKRNHRNASTFNEHTQPLEQLEIGDRVRIQNQTGPSPKRWHRTGRVVEDTGPRQYRIKIDGSNRVTLRNRRFLHKFDPIATNTDVVYLPPNIAFPTAIVTSPTHPTGDAEDKPTPHQAKTSIPVQPSTSLKEENSSELTHPTQLTAPAPTLLRRSARVPRRPRALSPQMRGKSHNYSEI